MFSAPSCVSGGQKEKDLSRKHSFPQFPYNEFVSGLLLQTKLFKPALRPSLITRPQLIAKLNASLGKGAWGFNARLTLVSAPAGFGKTTLVSAWLAQLAAFNQQYAGERAAWLSKDENDNYPVRFLTYLIAARKQPHQAVAEAWALGLL
jgi:ATP/maltotriose-dependent transcriptional regulator MalT